MIRFITFWLNNARTTALPQSLMPAFLAVCMALQTETFSISLSVFAILGVIFVHLGANLTDDYFDYKKNRESIQSHNSISPIRKGKCNYLLSGKVSEKQLVKAILIIFTLAFVMGGIIFAHRGIVILYFILITGFLSVSYSGYPLHLSYHGMGELIIGLICGPLLMSGVFYAACGLISKDVWIVSSVVGLLVANILYVHSVMDYEADKSIHKQTLAVIIKNKTIQLVLAFLFTFSPYGIIALSIGLNYISLHYLASFLLLPLSIVLFYLLSEYVKHPENKYKPRFWMGPMEKWEAIQNSGIDQFMIRWFLARNISIFFCIIIAIISFIK
ncbi:MAG: prenyltransferase [Bacteroidales bacterium]|nr:prenyltransferase [Bacteroidales bacterium]MDD4210080.1 prenyltransferase [Bacteroidales bacterium]